MDCIFCKIVQKEIPAKIIFEDDSSISFLDAFPLKFGHVLVIPKNHHSKLQDLSNDENTSLFRMVQKITPKLESVSDSSLIAIHNGKNAGQEIPHVHVHLIPRDKNDGAGPIHSMFSKKVESSDAEIDELLKVLKS